MSCHAAAVNGRYPRTYVQERSQTARDPRAALGNHPHRCVWRSSSVCRRRVVRPGLARPTWPISFFNSRRRPSVKVELDQRTGRRRRSAAARDKTLGRPCVSSSDWSYSCDRTGVARRARARRVVRRDVRGMASASRRWCGAARSTSSRRSPNGSPVNRISRLSTISAHRATHAGGAAGCAREGEIRRAERFPIRWR